MMTCLIRCYWETKIHKICVNEMYSLKCVLQNFGHFDVDGYAIA